MSEIIIISARSLFSHCPLATHSDGQKLRLMDTPTHLHTHSHTHVMFSVEDVLLYTLSYLPASDLLSSAAVCQSFNRGESE